MVLSPFHCNFATLVVTTVTAILAAGPGCASNKPKSELRLKTCQLGVSLMQACYDSAATETCGSVHATAQNLLDSNGGAIKEMVPEVYDQLLGACDEACDRRKRNEPYNPGRIDCNDF